MHRRANKTRRNRKFRWLLEAVIPADDARVPVHLRGGLIRTRLDTTDDDRARKINRAENLRPIHRYDPRSSVVIDQRNRAEILFSRVKHRWANGRIPAVGVP